MIKNWDWAAFKKDLTEGIQVLKSTSVLQNELVKLRMRSDQSPKEFSDSIKEMLKELNDIISSQYDNPEVVTSFKTEHEKIAIRTFKEGLPTPLKFRIVNYEAKTLDEILKRTLEEEPFVGISKPSASTTLAQSVPQNRYFLGNRLDYTNYRNQPRRPTSFQIAQRQAFNSNNWQARRNLNQQFQQMNPFSRWNNYFQKGDQIQQGNINYEMSKPNDHRSNPFVKNQLHQENFRNSPLICSHCNKIGHSIANCYSRIANEKDSPNDNNTNSNNNVKKVSFLEMRQNRQKIPGRKNTLWSNDRDFQ